MSIQVEFSPDLALRDMFHFRMGKRKIEECIPENLEEGKIYTFLKYGHRVYWFDGEIPLVKTEGSGKTSSPFASVLILEVVHFVDGDTKLTRGKYLVKEVFGLNDAKPHFNGFQKI